VQQWGAIIIIIVNDFYLRQHCFSSQGYNRSHYSMLVSTREE
jgi:hypothetical protein